MHRIRACVMGLSLLALIQSGCGISPGAVVSRLQRIANKIGSAVNNIQSQDPRVIVLPAELEDRGDTVVIDQHVTVVTNVTQDLTVDVLPNITLLGFENQTGFDIFVRYAVDGEFQSVFVLDGETVLLDYPCITSIDLISEDDVDPVTGDFVATFDLSDVSLLNSVDFTCGDAVIITLDPTGVTATNEIIDLTAQ